MTAEERTNIDTLVASHEGKNFDDVLKGANIDLLEITFKADYGLDPEDAYQLDDSFDSLKKARTYYVTITGTAPNGKK